MKKRIFYGCIVVTIIILVVYFIILLKRGIILSEENPIAQECYSNKKNEFYQEKRIRIFA